uniref:Uncharacterized protein n=2 Tax=Emiliania huxleyi TaxID=2903 RepID=A0A6U8SIV0_EMIHU
MIDSDAFLRSGRLSLRIDELVADHVAKRHGEWSFASQRNGGPRTPLWMAGNAPFKPAQPNAGLQVWRGGPLLNSSWDALRRWWAADVGDFHNRHHPYEQAGINRTLERGRDYGVLLGLEWLNKSEWRSLPAAHISSVSRFDRMRVLAATLANIRGSFLQRCGQMPNATSIDATRTAERLLERRATQSREHARE